MTDLEKARQKINQVDTEMRELFLERMKASKIVAEYKRLHGMQVFDPQREAEVLARNSAAFGDEELKDCKCDSTEKYDVLSKVAEEIEKTDFDLDKTIKTLFKNIFG